MPCQKLHDIKEKALNTLQCNSGGGKTKKQRWVLAATLVNRQKLCFCLGTARPQEEHLWHTSRKSAPYLGGDAIVESNTMYWLVVSDFQFPRRSPYGSFR